MKKLFTLLIITLLSVTTFSQTLRPEIGMGGDADMFSQKSACELYNIYKQDGMENAFLENTFSFTANGRQYVVSYNNRPDDINSPDWTKSNVRTRLLYLFYLTETGWELALDEPLRNDFKTDIGFCSYYFPRFNIGNDYKGGVIVQENGTIILNLIIIYNELSSLDITRYKVQEIRLEPINDGMYKKVYDKNNSVH